jgi:hypothetical protein
LGIRLLKHMAVHDSNAHLALPLPSQSATPEFHDDLTPSFADVDVALVGTSKDKVHVSDLDHQIIIRHLSGVILLEIRPQDVELDDAEDPLCWDELLRCYGILDRQQLYIDLVDMDTTQVIRLYEPVVWFGHYEITCVRRYCPRCTLCGKACTSEGDHLLCNHGGIKHLWHPQSCRGGAPVFGYINLPPSKYSEVAARLGTTEEQIRMELSHIAACMLHTTVSGSSA